MKNHIETHMEGISFSCSICERQFRSRNSIDVVQFQEKFSFLKKVLLPKILLRLPTVHYGCYLQVSLRCELYTVSTTWLFFAISHLAIIMKSDHDQKQPSSTATPYIPTVHYGLQKNVG